MLSATQKRIAEQIRQDIEAIEAQGGHVHEHKRQYLRKLLTAPSRFRGTYLDYVRVTWFDDDVSGPSACDPYDRRVLVTYGYGGHSQSRLYTKVL